MYVSKREWLCTGDQVTQPFKPSSDDGKPSLFIGYFPCKEYNISMAFVNLYHTITAYVTQYHTAICRVCHWSLVKMN